jgi:hypothetical protein
MWASIVEAICEPATEPIIVGMLSRTPLRRSSIPLRETIAVEVMFCIRIEILLVPLAVCTGIPKAINTVMDMALAPAARVLVNPTISPEAMRMTTMADVISGTQTDD